MKRIAVATRFAALCLGAVGLLLSAASAPARSGELEVLHYWTSGGEAKSVEELKALIAKRGHVWRDFTVTGGGGENAMTMLNARVARGNPPAAANIKGPAIQEWAAQNVLTNLDAMASFDKWDQSLPKVVADRMKYRGHYVAVPVNVHRVNWMWGNVDVLRNAGVTEMPRTFDAFFAAADKLRAAGVVPLAHGGQDWQDFTVFESVVLGVAGPAVYNKALVQLDSAAIQGDAIKKSFEVFRRLKGYTDSQSFGRDWNVATDMVIKGKAGFQFMGDWAKGEFLAAGQQPGQQFRCAPTPGTQGSFTFNVDSFAMFQLKSWEAQKAQGYLAYLLMGADFQERFNLRKGSIPVRSNVAMDRFDACAKVSSQDFNASSAANTLLPSLAHGMALSTAQQAAMRAAVSDFWNNDQISIQDVQNQLLSVRAATSTSKP